MNWWIIGAIVFIAALYTITTILWNKLQSPESEDGKFVWQPDLSHKVIVSEYEASRPMGGTQQTVILVEKTREERALERKSYLKENRK